MSKSLSNAKWLLYRKNPQTGYREEIVFTGNIKLKPKGWKVYERVSNCADYSRLA